MAQFARPDSDVSAGSWVTAPLWQQIDESSPSDADFITGPTGLSYSACEIGLSNVTDPVSSSGHIARYRYRKNPLTTETNQIRVTLLQGAAQIAQWEHTGIGTTFVQQDQTLSGAQADSITDYADLRVTFESKRTGLADPLNSGVDVSWDEFEVPDAPAAGPGPAKGSLALMGVGR